LLKLTLPPKTTEVLGEEAAAEFARWITETVALRDEVVQRDEYREVLSRLDIIEHDLAGVKERLNAIEGRLDRMQSDMNVRFDAVNARFDTLEERLDTRLEALEERFDTRLEALEERFDARLEALEERFDARLDTLHGRIDTVHEAMRSQTRWLVGTLIAVGGFISVLITVFKFIQ
jgi:tetrahydromethanopterin S-methyltransferase subunit G